MTIVRDYHLTQERFACNFTSTNGYDTSSLLNSITDSRDITIINLDHSSAGTTNRREAVKV
jgi:hypothetical protein